ncbi:ABC transporter G family member 20 [Brachionus plicatilis]|uniref:ABC transporter G family member 20 n=1 Tax=Brachionus plicatilis TaxID=10195 RepID=A0A3M7SSQ1_BRAPC|nr:ABC transporter G family member 20 [Brachionus plicatilis]
MAYRSSTNLVNKLLPLTYATDSFRAILEKDWSIGNEKVFKGFLVTYAWTILFLIVFLISHIYKSLNLNCYENIVNLSSNWVKIDRKYKYYELDFISTFCVNDHELSDSFISH